MAIENTTISEGKMTRKVEGQTAKVPSLGYLGLAVASMAISASLAFVFRKRELANFVGLWAPSILIIGLYNKVVKQEHEQLENRMTGEMGSSESRSAVNRPPCVFSQRFCDIFGL